MRPVTQYLKPETKDPEAEAAILTPDTCQAQDDAEVSKPKTDDNSSAPTKDQPDMEKNGNILAMQAGKEETQLTTEDSQEGMATAEVVAKKSVCSCCLPAKKCLICRIFLMINWRLLLDRNFVIIAVGKIFYK